MTDPIFTQININIWYEYEQIPELKLLISGWAQIASTDVVGAALNVNISVSVSFSDSENP